MTRAGMTKYLRVHCHNVKGGVKVAALLHPCGLAVTERITPDGKIMSQRGGYGFTVTHTASGTKLTGIAGGVDHCWSVILRLKGLTDWSLSKNDLKRVAGLGLKVAAASESVGRGNGKS
jgi:hypothetical protein